MIINKLNTFISCIFNLDSTHLHHQKTNSKKKIMKRIHLHIALLCLSSDRLSYDYEQEQDWIIWDANMT